MLELNPEDFGNETISAKLSEIKKSWNLFSHIYEMIDTQKPEDEETKAKIIDHIEKECEKFWLLVNSRDQCKICKNNGLPLGVCEDPDHLDIENNWITSPFNGKFGGNYTHWLVSHMVDLLKDGIWLKDWSLERLEAKNKTLRRYAQRSLSMKDIVKDKSLLPLRLLQKSRRVDFLKIIREKLEKFNKEQTNLF